MLLLWANGLRIASDQYTVYALADPREPDVIRYVGVTVTALRTKLQMHCGLKNRKPNKTGRPYKTKEWVQGLLAQGLKPLIYELAKCEKDEASEVEKHWIQEMAAKGNPLLNVIHNNSVSPQLPVHFDTSVPKMLKDWQGDMQDKVAAAILDVPVGTFRHWKYGKRTPSTLTRLELERRLMANGLKD